jgi:3-hydroxymyristoyl/3-hydroxydecanoyl-(acyl carrier protein) dehydratase
VTTVAPAVVPMAAPLVAVDTVEADGDVATGLAIRATKHVDPDELYLRGHFPGFVIYPGVFIIESLIQAVAHGFALRGYPPPPLRTLRSVRFLAPILAGDSLRLDITAVGSGADAPAVIRAIVHRGDGTVAAKLFAEFGGPNPARSTVTGAEAPPVGAIDPDPPVVATEPDPSALEHGQIQAMLPQRYPMLLLDRALHVTPGIAMTAVKAVSATDPCYRSVPAGAPPEAYAFPVSLLVESFGQAAAVVWLSRHPELDATGSLPLLAVVRDFRIEGDVRPGDVIRHEVQMDHAVDGAGFGTGEIFVGDRRIATVGSLLAVVRPDAALRLTSPSPSTTD